MLVAGRRRAAAGRQLRRRVPVTHVRALLRTAGGGRRALPLAAWAGAAGTRAVDPAGFTPAPGHHWGAVSLDWQVGEGVWINKTDYKSSTCEATSAANCARLKATGAVKLCGIYHNVELALSWIESARAVMYDPAKASWFLQFTDGNGTKNGTIYNQPRAEGDQYFIDWRNAEAAA